MAFHAHSEWFFERVGDDGKVAVTHPDGTIEFDAGTWASIVASVSQRGETGETFRLAQDLHSGALV